MRFTVFTFLLLGIFAAFAQGQTSSRFDTMETTYRENLIVAQKPVMEKYLADLQSLLAKSKSSDADAIRFEIARIHKHLAENLAIDLVAHKETAPTNDKAQKKRGIVFTLDPEEASPPQAKDTPVPLGTASWTFSKLAPGKYDLVAVCACPGPLPAVPVVTITYHGITETREIQTANLTRSATNFRLLPLCRITLTEEVLNERLTISTPPGSPWLFAKQLHLTKAKD